MHSKHDRPVDMEHHERLTDPFKLEVHNWRESSADQLSRQAPQLQGLLRGSCRERSKDGICLCIDDMRPLASGPKLACPCDFL